MKRRARALLFAAILAGVATSALVRAQAPAGGGAPTTSGWGAQPPPTSSAPIPILIVPPSATATGAAPPAATYVIVQQVPLPQSSAPPAASTSAPAAPAPDEDAMHSSVKLELGGAYRQVHGVSVFGGTLDAGFGLQNRRFGHYVLLDLLIGATDQSLRTSSWFFGYGLDLRFDVVRVGFGVELGYLIIRRASLDKRMYALGIGALGHVGVDLVKLGRNGDDALYLDARLSGSMHYGDAGYWGPTLSLGFRL